MVERQLEFSVSFFTTGALKGYQNNSRRIIPTPVRAGRAPAAALLACLVLAPLTAPDAQAQTYFNYDGTTTSSLSSALATWTSAAEFAYKKSPIQGDWGLAAMNAQYAYALGYNGPGVKLGAVDSGLLFSHEEFATRGNVTALSISGRYRDDGYQRDQGDMRWKAGDAFATSGAWNGTANPATGVGANDNHGSHVSGTIAAAKNGLDANGQGMMGVAWGSNYYITNTNGTDASIYASNMDYNYFYQAYGALAKAGVRAINSSWGSPSPFDNFDTVAGLAKAYASTESLDANGVQKKKSWLDAAADVSLQTGVLQVFAAGNTAYNNPNIRSSVPYFRPELESSWLTVAALNSNLSMAGFSNVCGIAKYWCLSAPGAGINSLQTTDAGYVAENGTSMAAPHVTGALGVIMQRYAGLDNTAVRTILLTTARHLGTGSADLPNSTFGWGIPDLQKAMNGPGQLLGVFNANIVSGTDLWSNNISEAALKQRAKEETAEIASWPTALAALKAKLVALPNHIDPNPSVAAGLPNAIQLLQKAIDARTAGNSNSATFTAALNAANADPVGKLLVAAYTAANPNWTTKTSLSSDLQFFIAGRANAQLADDLVNPDLVKALAANAAISNQILLQQNRVKYLAAKTSADYVGTFVKIGAGTLTLTGNNSYSGGTQIREAVLGLGSSTAFGLGAVTIQDGATLQLAGQNLNMKNAVVLANGLAVADSQAYTGTISGKISGAGGLAKIGLGTLVLSGSNSYAGPTGVLQGALQGGAANAFSALSAHVVYAGATLDVGGFDQKIGALAGAGTVTNSGAALAQLTAGSNGADSVFSGLLADGGGALGLTKAGAGTMILAGNNTYSGGTTLSAGTLGVASSSALGTGVLTTFDGSRLAFFANNLNLANGVTLANGVSTIDAGGNSATLSGTIAGAGGMAKAGDGTLTLGGQNTYTGATTVSGGGLIVTGSIASSALTTVQSGAMLGGSGTVGNTFIDGGTLAPGASIGGLTVQGDLAMTSAARYMLGVSPTAASSTTVTGTAQLGSATLLAAWAPGSYVMKRYTVMTAGGGIAGTFAGPVDTNLPANFASSLSYDRNDAYLNLSMSLAGLNRNQQAVSNALVNSFNAAGGIPFNIGALSAPGLTVAAGEAATAVQQPALSVMNSFTEILSGATAPSAGGTSAATGQAAPGPSEGYSALGMTSASPVRERARWAMWGTGFASEMNTRGNVEIGASSSRAQVFGSAAGATYHVTRESSMGFAVGGAGTNFSLSDALGRGRAEVVQGGVYGRYGTDGVYLSGALSYGWQDTTTERNVLGDQLKGHFNANAVGARLEGGVRVATPWVDVTPYAALAGTALYLPSYAERGGTAGTSALFALGYGGTVVRSPRREFGVRFEQKYALNDSAMLFLRARTAWAHNLETERSVQASFLALPSSSFLVSGAAAATDSALLSASAEIRWKGGIALTGSLESDVSRTSQAYSAKADLKWEW